MNNKDIANEWFMFADSDLDSAKFLLRMHPIPLTIICYHCQQSAEKYLKGYLALRGSKIIKTHELTFLNNVCIKVDASFLENEEDCIELADYGVQVRYPFHVDLEERDMEKAINSAEKIKGFVLARV